MRGGWEKYRLKKEILLLPSSTKYKSPEKSEPDSSWRCIATTTQDNRHELLLRKFQLDI